MNSLMIPMIGLGVILLFGAIYLIFSKPKNGSTTKVTQSQNKTNTGKTSSGAESINKEDVFKFMEFEKVQDNMIVQQKGTRYTMVMKCKGINYDLMSEVEQLAVEEGFITFLNTLKYPIQLYVQAQNIDLKEAISKYKENTSSLQAEYMEVTEEFNSVREAFDATDEELNEVTEKREKVLNVYEYANDIINYVEKLSLNKSLLQRSFYILVSYNSSEISSAEKFSKDEKVSICYNELLTRCQSILSGLSSCSVSGVILNSNEVAELLYTAYNRDDKNFLNVKEAIDSGFYRLYSTSEDAFLKKQEMLQEAINNEAKIKAIEAIKIAIDDGTYAPPSGESLGIAEEISKQAYNKLSKEKELPNEIKEKAKKILVDDYRAVKQNLVSKISEEIETKKEEIKNVEKVNGKIETSEINNKDIKKDSETLKETLVEEKIKNENKILEDELIIKKENTEEKKYENANIDISETTNNNDDSIV
ncbi:MAG: hypothetical protein RSA08_04060 [Clostridia bacterium]